MLCDFQIAFPIELSAFGSRIQQLRELRLVFFRNTDRAIHIFQHGKPICQAGCDLESPTRCRRRNDPRADVNFRFFSHHIATAFSYASIVSAAHLSQLKIRIAQVSRLRATSLIFWPLSTCATAVSLNSRSYRRAYLLCVSSIFGAFFYKPLTGCRGRSRYCPKSPRSRPSNDKSSSNSGQCNP